MIPTLDVNEIDLGKDKDRIGAQDAQRQTATVNHILRAFYGPLGDRREVQVLADEVGMGKTYVALGVAYAAMSFLRDKNRSAFLDDVANCYKCVLVITPSGNGTLADKWDREDEALLTRCARDTDQSGWFKSVLCNSADQLLQAIYRANDLRRRNSPVILVAQSNVFTKRLSDPAVRFVTACLFRWWSNGLQTRERYHLVRGLSETVGSQWWADAAQWSGRGEYEINLWDWARHEQYLAASDREREQWEPRWERSLFSEVSVSYRDMQTALDRFSRAGGAEQLEQLRVTCKSVPLRKPADRRTAEFSSWVDWFRSLKNALRDVFKELWPYLLERHFPLVITDEAHHWRNNEAGDFRAIRKFIAPYTKRLLLLTATPFQLNPHETVNVLNVIEHMQRAIGSDRMAVLIRMRERLSQCMDAAEKAGRAFSREWGSLADQLARWDSSLSDIGSVEHLENDPRVATIEKLWSRLTDSVNPAQLDSIAGPIRPFFARAMEMRKANQALCQAMRPLFIRHRRSSSHRRYWVGREYPPKESSPLRPDFNRLHLAPGQSLEARDELVQYLLMKVVAALSQGRHRTTLGTALTGCYTTMWESKEGRNAIEAAAQGDHRGLVKILQQLTGKANRTKDADHPKVRRIVDAVLDRWDRGEKSLIFCFRVPTAQTLYAMLALRIDERLHKKRHALLKARGTEATTSEERDKAMQQFRRSLTAREASGIPLFVDRVLLGWMSHIGAPVPTLTQYDVCAVAALAVRARVKGRPLFANADRPDRVFLSRAIEHVWAKRMIESTREYANNAHAQSLTNELLQQISDEAWVRDRYGLRQLTTGADAESVGETERAARSSLAAHYDLDAEPDSTRLESLTKEFLSRYEGGRGSVFQTLVEGPNLTAPSADAVESLAPQGRTDAKRIREAMFGITLRENQWNWTARRDSVDALVRALLRDDLLLRMPTHVFAGQDETWATAIFAGLHQPFGLAAGMETLAQRIIAFLEELGRMSDKERESYLEYAMNPKAEAVALVMGETKSRSAVFAGFNTPLLPEILICTAVGQEGIDLHRECRHVIHYDLGWNPATIEQRTGRTDRIGSKTERERKLIAPGDQAHDERLMPGLDIGLPYLAATYDERMFDALRTRAQVFEILTGGDPTADRDTESPWSAVDEEGSDAGVVFVPLPARMLDDLKVDLSVVLSSNAPVSPSAA